MDCFCVSLCSSQGGRGGAGAGVITDEDLAETATDSKPENIQDNLRMLGNKCESICQFGAPRVKEEITQSEHGREGVQRGHHLRPTHDTLGGAREDVVLDRVCEAVKEQVNAQQEHAPHDVLLRVPGAGLFRCLGIRGVQGEDGDTGGDEGYDSVLVDWVFTSEERDVQEHDGEELA